MRGVLAQRGAALAELVARLGDAVATLDSEQLDEITAGLRQLVDEPATPA